MVRTQSRKLPPTRHSSAFGTWVLNVASQLGKPGSWAPQRELKGYQIFAVSTKKMHGLTQRGIPCWPCLPHRWEGRMLSSKAASAWKPFGVGGVVVSLRLVAVAACVAALAHHLGRRGADEVDDHRQEDLRRS